MSETTPLIKAALNLRVGVGFDVYAKLEPFDKTNAGSPHKYKLSAFLSLIQTRKVWFDSGCFNAIIYTILY